MSDNFVDFQAMAEVIKHFRMVSQGNREFLLKKLTEEHEAVGDKNDYKYGEIKRKYLASGGRHGHPGIIPAIKEVRMLGGMGLKEAKDEVESWG